MNCESVLESLDLLHYGELTFEEEERLRSHLARCPQCTAVSEQTARMHSAVMASSPQVPYPLLLDCRRNLRLALPESQPPRNVRRPWWQMFIPGPAAVAAVLSFMAFLAGRQFPADSPFSPASPPSPENTAYRVRSVEPGSSGRVNLVVEEVRQRTITGETGDQQIRSLLLSAAREASDPGVRVETVDLLRSQTNSAEVRTALLAALEQDANPGVRLRALECLRPWTGEAEIRKSLARVVLKDTNPGVRTQAIDLLTQSREPALVGVLQEALAREDNNYVRLKCRKVLHEMKASEETF